MRVRRWRERLAFRIAPWVFPAYREAMARERRELFQAHLDAHRVRLGLRPKQEQK